MNITTRMHHSARLLTLALLGLLWVPSQGLAEESLARNSDKELKAIIVSIGKAEKRFEKALDSKFKKAILRGPGGEVAVKNYLEDLATAITRLEKRFTSRYSASTEAAELLDRASRMHGYVRENPGLKGANEWDSVAAQLQQLAMSYGVNFPLTEGQVVRRVGDGELADAADAMRKFSGDFERVLRKSTSRLPELAEPVKVGVADLKALAEKSKLLASRVRSGKPASAEARQLIGLVQRVGALVDSDGMPEAVASEWNKGEASVAKIAQAFGLTVRSEPESEPEAEHEPEAEPVPQTEPAPESAPVP